MSCFGIFGVCGIFELFTKNPIKVSILNGLFVKKREIYFLEDFDLKKLFSYFNPSAQMHKWSKLHPIYEEF